MNYAFTTVSSKGQLVIPKEIRDHLEIEPGTRIGILVEGNRIILQPSNRRLLDELCGITAGHGSMADELIAERRAEHQKSEEELKEWMRSKGAQ
jgi:AbrB family looped-hinge helix DNA binding protein